jgi:predicted nucleic acid-binding protein
MGSGYLVDSNIIIHTAANSVFEKAVIKKLGELLDREFQISIITKIEILSKDDSLSAYVDLATVIMLNEAIINETINIRRKHNTKLPDAIIAATAVVNKLKLLTHNTKDFNNIKGLTTVDPFDL